MNRGITLLEVLISIGILAIGLIGTLSLIPAGGSYLRKAQVEGRAASLIPNAFNTMKSAALFSKDAIDWTTQTTNRDEVEEDVWGYPSNPYGVADETETKGEIRSWYIRDDPPWIEGTGAGANQTVVVRAEGPGGVTKEFKTESDGDGNWQTPLLATDLSLSGPPKADEERMQIIGDVDPFDQIDPDEYYDEWVITHKVGHDEGKGTLTVNLPEAPNTPQRKSDALVVTRSNTYTLKHYRKRRSWAFKEGNARLDFTLPQYKAAKHSKNDDTNKAQSLNLPTGYDQTRCRISGAVWRYDTGKRDQTYQKWQHYRNGIADGIIQEEILADTFFTSPEGSAAAWAEGGGSGDIQGNTVDWYEFNVLRDQRFRIAWDPENDVINKSLSNRYVDADNLDDLKKNHPVEIYFNGAPIQAGFMEASETDHVEYRAPSTGTVQLKVELLGLLPEGDVDEDAINPWRKNGELKDETFWFKRYPRVSKNLPADPDDKDKGYLGNGTSFNYSFNVTLFGSTQVALIDPLMAAKIELANGPGAEAITKAAVFDQDTDVLGFSVPFTLRRLNWNIVSKQETATNRLSVASSFCIPEDVMVVKVTDDELEAPEPWFELQELSTCHRAPVYVRYDDGWTYCDDCRRQCTSIECPMRRETDDRLSWMLTVQPEGGGSIQEKWNSGNYFDVAIVVFRDRVFPSIGFPQVEGEYSFDSWWNEDTGTIRLNVNRSTGIDGDDIRKMFAAGNWVMVAPKKTDWNQKVDWLKIQNAEFTRDASQTIVEIIPVEEPETNTDLGPDPNRPGAANLVTMVYQGVVAVSRRSVRITD